MTIKTDPFEVDQFVDADRVASDVATNCTDLQGEFVRQAGLVYFYTSMVARAERQHSELKLRLEATEAKVGSNVREDALKSQTKMTVDAISSQVRLHPTVVRIEQSLIKAKEVETMLKGVVEALRHKRDSLQMLGFQERDERRASIAVMEDAPGQGAAQRYRQERLASA